LAAAEGRGEEALSHLAAAIAAFEEIGDRGYIAAALGLRGAEFIKQGKLLDARDAYSASLELAIELADHTWEAWALLGAAHLAHGADDHTTATRLLGAATAMREASGERRLPKGALTPALQAVAESERFVQEWTEGRRMADEDVLPLARAVFARAVSQDGGRRALPTLTAREREVLSLLADGVGDKAIAVALGISRRTASHHVAAILGKLGAESRTAAVSHALRQNFPLGKTLD
jgi:DNA-binding CsgD family transcriptional regulator